MTEQKDDNDLVEQFNRMLAYNNSKMTKLEISVYDLQETVYGLKKRIYEITANLRIFSWVLATIAVTLLSLFILDR